MAGKLLEKNDIIELVRDGVKQYNLMTPQCFESLVVQGDLGNMDCMTSLISKVMGLGMVVCSSLVKLPQLFKIMFGESAEGISFTSVLLELLGITIAGLYSYAMKFPFSAYGESVFLAAQTALIAMMVLWFSTGRLAAIVFLAVYGAGVFLGLDPHLCPVEVLWYGQAINIPMMVVGKSMQIWANFSNGHTGQLSAITTFLVALGTCARIFTSIMETGDEAVIVTYIVASILHCMIALQVMWYWSETNQALANKTKTE